MPRRVYVEDFGYYTDFGPSRDSKGRARWDWVNRPHCDMCGPFRGRHLRIVGTDEHGHEWRCKGCDEE